MIFLRIRFCLAPPCAAAATLWAPLTPPALTALTGDSLAQLNILNPIDLNGRVRGLVFTASEGARDACWRGRGCSAGS